MALDMFGPNDPLGIALEQMGKQAGYVSPMLIVHGADAVGNEKTGTLDLNISQDMPYEEKLAQTAAIGKFAATLKPYFSRLNELYFVNKSVLDLQPLGMGTEVEAFVISHVEVAANEFTTKVFTLIHDKSGLKGVRCVATQAEPLEVNTSQPYQLLKTFMKSYSDAKPMKPSN